MRSNAIQNINNTGYRQNVANANCSKPYRQIPGIGIENVISANPLVLHAPCDTQLLIRNHNVSFGSYNITTLSPEELEATRNEVKSKIDELNIKLHWRDKDYILNPAYERADVGMQVMKILLNHPIIELNSVKHSFSVIASTLTSESWVYARALSMLDFADLITSDDNKQIYENETVQKYMGEILFHLMQKDVFDAKKHLVKYLHEHNEILSEDVNIGLFLAQVDFGNYDKIVRQLSKFNKSEDKSEDKKRQPSLLELLFGETEREPLGQIVKKTGDNDGFARVGGQHEAIEKLKNLIVFPHKYPQLYEGFNPPKGAVLYGPPGTGKSLMAQALAEEMGYYYVNISSGGMKSKYVGQTETNWNDLFKELEQNQPALLFIDEVDALASDRDTSNQYAREELSHVLKLISDIKAKNLNVFVLTATNKLHNIDDAFLRAGRIEEQIAMLPPQTTKEIEEIFDIHIKNKKIDAEDINKNKQTIFKHMLDLNYTGADIERAMFLAHRAALARTGLQDKMDKGTITQEDQDNFNIKAIDFMVSMDSEFKTDIPKYISPIYKTKDARANTVAILGSSKTTDEITNYKDICSDTVKDLVLNGKNIVTGCGSDGIMGSAFYTAKEYSQRNEKGEPVQNLAIIKKPLWGDEDLENCITLTSANSEADRIEMFSEVADTIIIFPGSAGTLQEAAMLINKNYYGSGEDTKKIILVGKNFFNGLIEQYNKFYESGLIKCSPNDLFTVADSKEEILKTLKI